MANNPSKFTWTDPTLNTDGTAVTAGEITGYAIGIRNTATTGSVAGTYPTIVNVPAAVTTFAINSISPPLTSGSFAAAIEAITALTVSSWSTEVTFTLAPTPDPPTGFTVS
jgi:hypothetical protein